MNGQNMNVRINYAVADYIVSGDNKYRDEALKLADQKSVKWPGVYFNLSDNGELSERDKRELTENPSSEDHLFLRLFEVFQMEGSPDYLNNLYRFKEKERLENEPLLEYYIAREEFAQFNYDESIEICQKLIELYPELSIAYDLLILATYEKGELTENFVLYDFLHHRLGYTDADHAAVRLYMDNEKYQDGLNLLEKVKNPDEEFLLTKAEVLFLLGRDQEGFDLIDSIDSEYTLDRRSYILSTYYLLRSDFKKAEEVYLRFLKLADYSLASITELMDFYAATRNIEKLEDSFNLYSDKLTTLDKRVYELYISNILMFHGLEDSSELYSLLSENDYDLILRIRKIERV
jgi:tetratricopeptide (TPR) repeat protein